MKYLGSARDAVAAAPEYQYNEYVEEYVLSDTESESEVCQ